MGPMSQLEAVDSSCVSKRIKNLIKLFEDASKSGKGDGSVTPKEYVIKDQKTHNITNALKMAQEIEKKSMPARQSSLRETEIEKCVSVKSIVYNYQKMSQSSESSSKTVSPPKPIPIKRASSLLCEIAKPEKEDSVLKMPQFEPPTQETDKKIDLLPTPPEPMKDRTPSCLSNADSLEDISLFDSDESEEEEEDSPVGKGITPLPDSYKVVSKNGKKLELLLPPPPPKSLLKKGPTKPKRNVQFSEGHEEGETYNQYEYARALEELDVVGATAEYEFEKMFARMDKIEFSIQKKPNERLGLQVCGVSIRSQNTKNNMAIYVKAITPGSLCDLCGKMRVDDLIIEINGIPLVGVEVTKVSETIRSAGSDIRFLVGRDTQPPDI